MSFSPGDIVTDITIGHPRLKRGVYEFRREGAECVLVDYVTQYYHAPRHVKKAVCVGSFDNGKKNVFYFRAANYLSGVMKSLYRRGFLTETGHAASEKRWGEIALGDIMPDVKKYVPKSEHLKKFKCWRLVETDRWIMPVPVSEYLDYAKGSEERFMPFPLPYGNHRQFLSPCYQEIMNHLPVKFEGKLKGKNGTERNVNIFLHGFLDPKKCHFGIRKHVLGCLGKPSQAKAALFSKGLADQLAGATGIEVPWEPDSWSRLLDKNVYRLADCNAFTDCPRAGADEKNCPRCEVTHFGVVHEKIMPLVKFYSEKFVTFLDELTTQVKDRAQLDVWSEDSFLAAGGSRVSLQAAFPVLESQSMKMVLNGVFYEGENDGRARAVFHVSMLTLFFSDLPLPSKRESSLMNKCGTVTL